MCRQTQECGQWTMVRAMNREGVSTWVGRQGELVRDAVLCAARVGGKEEGSRRGVLQVSSQSHGVVV